MTDNPTELWKLEGRLWTGGANLYRSTLHPMCLMAFPSPAGILTGQAIVDAVSGAPRWDDVEMTDQHVVQPVSGVAVLAYRVAAKRGSTEYNAFCTSSYMADEGDWRLIQHQQTPVS